MTTTAHRINELQKRQRYDGDSFVVTIESVNGYWYYNVYVQISTDEIKMLPWVDLWKLSLKKNTGNQKIEVPKEYLGKLTKALIQKECLVIRSKYNGEDPLDLIENAQIVVGKWKIGKQVKAPVIDTSSKRLMRC